MAYTISDRVQYAGLILSLAYSSRSGDEIECQATDIVADIRHLCDAQGISFADIVRMSEVHHKAELAETALNDDDNEPMISPIH